MPKGILNKKYTGEFKQMVVETMQKERLSYREAARQYKIKGLPPAVHRKQALEAA